MPSLNTLIAHHIVDQTISLLRLSAGLRGDVLSILGVLETQLIGKLAGTKLTAFNDARWRSMMSAVTELTGTAFDKAGSLTERVVQGVMEFVVRDTADTVRGLIGIDLLGRTNNLKWIADVAQSSLTQGATNAQWWAKQSQELIFKFEQQVKLGMIANETTDKIIARIRGDSEAAGVLFQTRANAAALVQTAVATGANDARLELYRRNADIIKGVQQISTLDERTTDICIAYDLAVWDLDGNPIEGTKLPFNGGPPRHWNCRSTLTPVVKSSAELGTEVEIDKGTRASMDGQVSDKTSFEDWLATKSPEMQDQILGKGRAQLWRDGKLKLRDLLDQSGRPLTLEQLEAQATSSRYASAALERQGPRNPTGGAMRVGLSGAPSDEEWQRENRALSALDKLGFPRDKVTFRYDSESFELNGRTVNVGGYAYTNNGRIEIFPRNLVDVEGLTAHEVEHIRYQSVLNAYSLESEAISKDTRTHTLESGRVINSVMRPSGELYPEFQKDYPVYTRLQPFNDTLSDQLRKDDGITQYSRDWWAEWNAGKASISDAMHETMAEISRQQTTLWPDAKAEPTPLWKEYHAAIGDLFEKYVKP